MEAAINDNTCAVLIEPIQCEAGILLPPKGYLKGVSDLCRANNALFLADEIQTGLGRTGKRFACDHEGVRPDAYILGKALSGGFYPVSALVGRRELIDVFTPGSHGSTYGGNPLGCAVARTALRVTVDEGLVERSSSLGAWFLGELKGIDHPSIKEVRGVGLLVGIELDRPARPLCEALMRRGLLCKETHDFVVRIAPPLVTEKSDLEWAVGQIKAAFKDPA